MPRSLVLTLGSRQQKCERKSKFCFRAILRRVAVSNFPIPANAAHPSEPAGPVYLKLQELPPEYPSLVFKEMVDGGGTHGADTTNKIRRFQLTYDGLTAAQFGQLFAHRAEAIDTFLGFNFRYYRASESIDELLSDCHYESFTYDHQKTWSRSCEIVICKRPA